MRQVADPDAWGYADTAVPGVTSAAASSSESDGPSWDELSFCAGVDVGAAAPAAHKVAPDDFLHMFTTETLAPPAPTTGTDVVPASLDGVSSSHEPRSGMRLPSATASSDTLAESQIGLDDSTIGADPSQIGAPSRVAAGPMPEIGTGLAGRGRRESSSSPSPVTPSRPVRVVAAGPSRDHLREVMPPSLGSRIRRPTADVQPNSEPGRRRP